MPQPWTSKLYIPVLAGLLSCFPSFVLAADTNEEIAEPGLFEGDPGETSTGWPRLTLAAGVAYLDADGVLAARPPASPPVTIINFDRVGLDEFDSSHWLSLTYRSRNSRWGGWFANWRYDVTGERIWENEWSVSGEQTIPVGAQVTSAFDADWYIAELTYSIVQNEKVDAGIGIGLHAVDLQTDLTARIDVGDDGVEAVQGDLNTLAPLPNFLAYAYWEISPKWNTVARMGWFGLEYDIYSGQMINAHFVLNYQLTPRLGVGAAYQLVRLDVDVERKNYREIYDIDFAGPMFFATFRF